MKFYSPGTAWSFSQCGQYNLNHSFILYAIAIRNYSKDNVVTDTAYLKNLNKHTKF